MALHRLQEFVTEIIAPMAWVSPTGCRARSVLLIRILRMKQVRVRRVRFEIEFAR
jgi:hypothetical protein